uniref:Uncharacterized protein n=1 Tax=Physcomitrium patens TaxID=3218 RepID=A0A7I3Z1Y0_PHYPA
MRRIAICISPRKYPKYSQPRIHEKSSGSSYIRHDHTGIIVFVAGSVYLSYGEQQWRCSNVEAVELENVCLPVVQHGEMKLGNKKIMISATCEG